MHDLVAADWRGADGVEGPQLEVGRGGGAQRAWLERDHVPRVGAVARVRAGAGLAKRGLLPE